MKQNFEEYMFVDEMSKEDNGFSYHGAKCLYAFLISREAETGIEEDFDAVGIRSEYSEYENLEDYNEQNRCDYTFEELCGDMQIIDIDKERFIAQNI